MTRPHDPTSPRWDLAPDPLPVDLDAIAQDRRLVAATFDHDGLLLAEQFGLVVTLAPREDLL